MCQRTQWPHMPQQTARQAALGMLVAQRRRLSGCCRRAARRRPRFAAAACNWDHMQPLLPMRMSGEPTLEPRQTFVVPKQGPARKMQASMQCGWAAGPMAHPHSQGPHDVPWGPGHVMGPVDHDGVHGHPVPTMG